jgi:hypothetical protein
MQSMETMFGTEQRWMNKTALNLVSQTVLLLVTVIHDLEIEG